MRPGYTTEEIARRGRRIREHDLRDELVASEKLPGCRPGALLYGLRVGEGAVYAIGVETDELRTVSIYAVIF